MDQASDLERRIDRERLVDRLAAMVQIPSVNPFGHDPDDATHATEVRGVAGEAAYGSHLLSEMQELGLSTGQREVEPGRPNVWGTLTGGPGPTLALAGHTDTVGIAGCDDPFSGRVADGRVHGRGSCDMKAAFAAYLEVAQVLIEREVELAGSLVIAGLVDEEYAMLGSVAWADGTTDGYPSLDHVILGEPTNLAVCSAHLGQFGVKIRTFGQAVHSSVPELGVNAIDKMGDVLGALTTYRDDIARRDPHHLCGTGRINPGVIRGGDIAAIVPDYCELEVDRRIPPGQTGADVTQDLRRYLDKLAADDPEFRYELSDPTWNIAPLDTPPAAPITTSVQRAAAGVGRPSDLAAFPGATDGPNLGVPTIVCGPGGLAQAHTIDEWVDIDEVVDAARLYLRATLNLLAG